MASYWTRARALLTLAVALSVVAGCTTRPEPAERTARSSGRLSASALSPEFSLQTMVPTTALSGSPVPHVAVATRNALVVWSVGDGTDTSIYAIRVDLNGAPIDALATLIAHWTNQATFGPSVSVGTDGTDFLVAYERNQEQLGARVRGSDGAVLDDAAHRLDFGTGTGNAVVAASGGRWLVVWSNGATVCGVWVVGDLVRPIAGLANLPIDPSTGGDLPSVAVGGGLFFVAANHRAIRLRATDGVQLDFAPISFANRSAGGAPVAAFDGTNFFVVWSTPFAVTPLFGARVRASDGVLLDPDDETNDASGSLVLLDDGRYRASPQPFFVDGEIDVAYLDVQGLQSPFTLNVALRAIVVDPTTGRRTDASPADPGTLVATNVQATALDVEFGSSGTGLVVAYSSDTFAVGASPMAHAQGLVTTPPWNPTPVSRVGRTTMAVQIASNETDWLVVWADTDPLGMTLRANRVRSADHAIADATPLLVGNLSAHDSWSSSPAAWGVAANGSDYVVVWLSGQSLFARTIGADGIVGAVRSLGSTTHAGTGAANDVAIGCDGVRCLVAWATQSPSIRARRFTAGLAPIDSSDLVVANLTRASPQRLSVVAIGASQSDEATFLVGVGATSDAVTYARVDSRLGSTPDSVMPRVVGSVRDYYDVVSTWASNGHDALVVWNDGVTSFAPHSFFGATLEGAMVPASDASTGSVGPASALAAAPSASPPVTALAWDGKAYVFASLDDDTAGVGRRPLRVARLAPSPALLDPPGTAPGIVAASLAGSTFLSGSFALSRGPGGTALIAYLSWDDASLGHVVRARVLTDDWDGTTLPDAGRWDAGFPQQADGADGGDAGDAGPPFEGDATLEQDADDQDDADADADARDGEDAGGPIIARRDAGSHRDAGAVQTTSGDGADGGLTGAAIDPAAWPYAASPLDERTSSGCGCLVGGDAGGPVLLGGSLGAALALLGAARRRRTRALTDFASRS